MDEAQLWQLHRQGRDGDLLTQAENRMPESVQDKNLCEFLGELFAGAGQIERAVAWYRQADTPAARQALPLLLLRAGELEEARRLLDAAQEHGAEWQEANYLLFLSEGPDPIRQIEVLEELLEEQYVEPYMTECAALYYLNERELKGRRMAKKQLSLFPGGKWEELAQMLLERGADCAGEVLAQIEKRRPIHPSGERSGVAPASTAPMPAPASTPPAPPSDAGPVLPEPVEACFQDVVGMEQARGALCELYAAVQNQAARASYELRVHTHCHLLIRGGTGSGKSLLAQRIAALLCRLSLSGQPDACVLDGPQLGDYLNDNGNGLEQALAQCKNRTVIIDGLSALFQDNGGSPVSPASVLHAVLKRHRDRVNFILLGSPKDMDHLLTLEPTLKGMFLYDISLKPYSPQELTRIAQVLARQKGHTLSADALSALENRLEQEYRSPVFQGGNSVDAILERAGKRLAQRLAQTGTVSKGTLMRLEPEDLDDTREGKSLEELLAELDSLTGLASVKEQVHRLSALAQTNQEAQRLGLPSAGFGTLHMVFTGNAGTGKTTVARIVGGIYRALGILPQGDKLVECVRGDLVGQYQGHTAPKVQAKVAEAMGGVLFIDEAYSLCGSGNDSFGQEAVDTLVSEIENHRADLMVILAGYSEDMDKFLDKNQGLASRFPNRMEFTDYSQSEMEQIFLGMLSGSGKRLEEGAGPLLSKYIAENRGKKGFGNARGIRNLKDKLMEAQSLRLAGRLDRGLTAEDFATVTKEDLSGLIQSGEKEQSLEDQLDRLRSLTGLSSVKEQVERKVYMVLAQKRMKEQNLGQDMDFGTLHMAFLGNAGTGKTTVARIIAGIYNTLGLLPDGSTFIECTRADLVGQYQGHTAEKVKEVVKRALGGVLFIDEAYSLCRDRSDSFGQEAVDTLIAEMENHRRELMVIVAGYSEDMARFFETNQGMESRIPTRLYFEDYTTQELFDIFQNNMKRKGLSLPEEAARLARQWIDRESREPAFGNARGVRNITEKIMERHDARIGSRISRGETPSREEYLTILPQDVEEGKRE